MIKSFQIEFVGFRVIGITLKDRRFFFAKQFQFQGVDNGECYFVLNVENVPHFAVVAC